VEVEWTLDSVVAATGGRLVGQHREGVVAATAVWSSVSTDSRVVQPGALFVPIRASRDGHDFITDAVAAGASGYLIESGRLRAGGLGVGRPEAGSAPGLPSGRRAAEASAAGAPAGLAPVGVPAVEVESSLEALLDLGRAARERLGGPVVGITGSVGKTSTKDLVASVLARRLRVTASARSFNNEIGVPLTLANAEEGTEVAVVEMGARNKGHIARLCDVARPTIGVVTRVAGVHTEVFGTLDEIAVAKAELVEALPASGTCVLNADDPRVIAMSSRALAPVLSYSAAGAPGADVVASEVSVDADLRATFVLRSPWGTERVTLAARGEHQVGNALAAAAVGLACGVGPEAVAAGLGAAGLSPWRMDLRRSPAGAVVLNDAYNANPVSLEAALRSLAALPARRRIAVLGEMAELGAEGPGEHRRLGALASTLGIELVVVATPAYGPVPVPDLEAAIAALGSLGDGDAVLVKGSRVSGLEAVASALVDPE